MQLATAIPMVDPIPPPAQPSPHTYRVVTDPRDPVRVPTETTFDVDDAVVRAKVKSRRWGRAYVLDETGLLVGEAVNGFWQGAWT